MRVRGLPTNVRWVPASMASRHHLSPAGAATRGGGRSAGGERGAVAPRRRAALRIVVVLVLTAGALLLLNALLTDVHVDSARSALGAAALIGLVNALVWPLVIRFALPLTVLTLGLGVLVLNGAVVLFVSSIDPGFHVDGLFAGIVVALRHDRREHRGDLAAGDRRRRVLVPQRRAAPGAPHRASRETTDVPGLFFLEIDGLAHDVLLRAHARRQRADDGALAARGRPPPDALGDRLVLADRRLPGRAAARRQRRHAGLPLVGEGPRQGDRHQPPARRDGDRAPPLRRPRAAVRQTAPAARTSSPATRPTAC